MQLQSALLLLGLTVTTTLAQTTNPACIQSCVTANPTSSWCDGDEEGAELEQCTCQSYAGSLMIDCMQDCSESDRAVFAAKVPELCRDNLFPGISADDSSATPTDDAAATSATDDAAEETASEDASATGEDEPSQTGEDAADASETGDGGSGALGRKIPGLLAAGGLVAALIL